MAAPEGFLRRWSRLKQAEPQPPEAPPPPPPQAEPAAEPPPQPDLPDIASLTKDSDFSPFLRPGVPEDTHREALRALWRSDPIFAVQDGLTDYAEDYANPDVVGDAVKTAWKLGRGFLDDDPPAVAAKPADETGAAAGEEDGDDGSA